MGSSTERILVIKHGAFGDLVQADGVLRDIRAFHADAEITLLTAPAFRKLMQRCPHIDKVLTDDRPAVWKLRSWYNQAKTLGRYGYAKVYDLQNSDRTRLYQRLFFRGISWCGRRHALTEPSALEGLVRQLEHEGIPTCQSLKPDVSWMVEDVTDVLVGAGVRMPYIALIPGCSARHPYKRWPYYPQLAKALLQEGYDVVVAPGPDEIELAKSIPGHTLLGENGFLDWFGLAGVLQRACFVIGNDTGPSHVASCLGKPGLALFSAHTSAVRTAIARGEFRTLEASDLAELSVEFVLAAVMKQLSFQENSV